MVEVEIPRLSRNKRRDKDGATVLRFCVGAKGRASPRNFYYTVVPQLLIWREAGFFRRAQLD
jgi:hypothetical protein